ncbi:MAG: YfcE family phosphodiesterase [Magnetococcales bacterium]|nr:YfcE family phosphodiesterase [Magnetococcales bacterium]
MKIGLISDSHDHLDHLERAVALFRERGVERIWHAGDIVCPAMVLALRGFDLRGVFGNNDGEKLGLRRAAEKIGGELSGYFLELPAPCGSGVIALYHGMDAACLEALILSGRYRAVVSGHTHRPENRMEGATLVLNPGTAHGFRQRATVMIYDDAAWTAALIDL